MPLRQKTLLVTGGVLAGLLALLLIISATVIMGGFQRAEEQDAQAHLRRVQSALAYELNRLEGLVGDWAAWDDTYAFAAERAARLIRSPVLVDGDYTGSYVSANLTDAHFRDLYLNLVLILDPAGREIYSKGYDLALQQSVPVPPEIIQAVRAGRLFSHARGATPRPSGIVALPQGLLLLAGRSILSRQESGAGRGTLLMGRFLENNLAHKIRELVQVEFALHPLGAPLPAPLAEAAGVLPRLRAAALLPEERSAEPAIFQHREAQRLETCTVLRDIFGDPELLLRVSLQRTTYRLGQLTLYAMLGLVLAAVLISAALMFWSLDWLVLRRLTRLDSEVREVSATRNLYVPITVNGGDELGALGRAVREMLQALAASRESEAAILEENRELIHQALNIQEKERKNLVRELHDEFGQCLTAIQADASAIREALPAEARGRASAEAILDVSGHMYEVMHSIMRRLRPAALDALGLVDALQDSIGEWQARHPEIRCAFTADPVGMLDDTLAINVYRVVQEGLTNIAKYAEASEVTISLRVAQDTQPARLVLTVADNGRGMDVKAHHPGLGLIGIRERAQAFGGRFELDGAPGQGVRFVFSVPFLEPHMITSEMEAFKLC